MFYFLRHMACYDLILASSSTFYLVNWEESGRIGVAPTCSGGTVLRKYFRIPPKKESTTEVPLRNKQHMFLLWIKHESWYLPGAAMSSTLVIKQPQPMMSSLESDEWGSGICDCFQDVPECESLDLISWQLVMNEKPYSTVRIRHLSALNSTLID